MHCTFFKGYSSDCTALVTEQLCIVGVGEGY